MAKRPHIVIFNPDQWRSDVMGCHGNPAAVTPVIDQLAATEAVSFSQAFCQNPVCTPSRCSFMTGWYTHVRGHRTMHHMLHPEYDEANLLQLLKDSGYFVWWGGKNDLVPGQDGFERHCTVKYRAPGEVKPIWELHRSAEWRGEMGDDTYYSFYVGCQTKGDAPYYRDGDWANVEGAVELIRNYDDERPLCIFLPLTYPHPPYGVEEPWFSMTDRAKLPPRIPAPESWEGKPSLLEGIWRNQAMQTWTEERWTELRAVYYGMCSRVDHQAGLVIDALREAGMWDDTAFFLFSDHGDFTGDYGLVEKTQNTFEDCLSRVPFVVKPPKSVPVKPRVSEALVELIDFTATAYELAGIDPGYDHFGRSLLPVLSGETDNHRDAVFCEGGRRPSEMHCSEAESDQKPGRLYWPRVSLQGDNSRAYHSKAVMCRTATHKYVRRLGESDELYDLVNDPGETRNVILDPAYAEVLAQLKDRLLEFYLETGDVVPRTTDKR